MLRRILIVAICAGCISLPDAVAYLSQPADLATVQSESSVSQGGKTLDGFQHRLDEYIAVRKAIASKVPEVSETGDALKISARERALGEAMAAARKDAKPGDLFGADGAAQITTIVRNDWASRAVADRKAIAGELPAGFKVSINRPYPTNLPLLSVPAGLLAKLPMLPEALEYRIVGRQLMLRDRDANLILDVLPDVIPR